MTPGEQIEIAELMIAEARGECVVECSSKNVTEWHIKQREDEYRPGVLIYRRAEPKPLEMPAVVRALIPYLPEDALFITVDDDDVSWWGARPKYGDGGWSDAKCIEVLYISIPNLDYSLCIWKITDEMREAE